MNKQQNQEKSSWDNWSVKNKQSVVIGGRSFVIQELDGEEYDLIKNIPAPVPPMKVKTKQDGSPIIIQGKPQHEPDYDAESYSKQLEEVEIKRALKILEFGLVDPDGHNIPGETDRDKWNFLKKGSAGSIENLTLEILRISSLLPAEVDALKEN
jgi:hypothetical protein